MIKFKKFYLEIFNNVENSVLLIDTFLAFPVKNSTSPKQSPFLYYFKGIKSILPLS